MMGRSTRDVVEFEKPMELRNPYVDMSLVGETTFFRIIIREVFFGFEFLEISMPNP